MFNPSLNPKLVNYFHINHLLRDIKDTSVGSLSQRITNQLMGLKGLGIKLEEMRKYLQQGLLSIDNFLAWQSFHFDSVTCCNLDSMRPIRGGPR